MYNNKNRNSIYNDIKLDPKGIDYENFLKLESEPIHKYIITKVNVISWYILFYLITYAIKREYICTTIKTIIEDLGIKKNKIEESLKVLHKNKLIYIDNYQEKISQNDILRIAIAYGTDKYKVDNIGYKPIPIDFLRRLIYNTTPEEFAIYCILFILFRYDHKTQGIDKTTGEIYYYYNEYNYSFPKLETIAEMTGICRQNVKKHIMTLASKNFITYEPSSNNKYSNFDEESNRVIIGNPNYRYRVKLLQRVEYLYYYFILNNDNRPRKTTDLISRKGYDTIAQTEQQDILIVGDYIKYRFNNQINYFIKALNEQNNNWYKSKPDIYAIDNFTNTDISNDTENSNDTDTN